MYAQVRKSVPTFSFKSLLNYYFLCVVILFEIKAGSQSKINAYDTDE